MWVEKELELSLVNIQAIRTRINTHLTHLGKKYHAEIPLNLIFNHVKAHGLTPVQEDGTPWEGFLVGSSGRVYINLQMDGQILNRLLVLDWYKMPSGKFEVTSYIS
jgi:hypothetical protein